jgi:hypothetical protein
MGPTCRQIRRWQVDAAKVIDGRSFFANYASQKKVTRTQTTAQTGPWWQGLGTTAGQSIELQKKFLKRGIYSNYFKSCIFENYVSCKWATHSLGSRTELGLIAHSLMFRVKKLDRPICNEKPTWETSPVAS